MEEQKGTSIICNQREKKSLRNTQKICENQVQD